jgi:hypothetical protein
VNTAGSATDTKTVIYQEPVVVQPPVITLTNPASCPAAFPRGVQTISGSVTNITNANQVVINYNGSPVNFTSSISNGVLTFSFQISISNTTVNIPLVINATNAGGSDLKSCTISIIVGNGNGNNGHGNNEDGVGESNPGQGGGGPNGQQGGEIDDENGNNGGGNTNGGSNNGGNTNGGSTNGGNTNGGGNSNEGGNNEGGNGGNGGNKSVAKPTTRPGTTVKPKPATPAQPVNP